VKAMKCDSCKYWDKELDEYPCNKCIHNAVEHYKPMTNFEKIKGMSIEQLAEFICGICDEEDGSKFINGIIIPDFDEYAVQEWLERTVE
jgi:hypothetical protein